MIEISQKPLNGKKGVILGIANEHSIAYGCAQAFRALGADLAITYGHDKSKPYVEPLARELEAPIFLPCDMQAPGHLDAVFQAINQTWGRLDFALHAIAFAPKADLHGRLADCSRGISCRDGRLLPFFHTHGEACGAMMTSGGAIFTLTYYGGEKVIEHYNVMGPIKAALEGAVHYLAYELGPKGIRVHAISPGPVKTRAASGLDQFDDLLELAAKRAPTKSLVSIEDVGMATAVLATDYAKLITGETVYVDGGYHILG